MSPQIFHLEALFGGLSAQFGRLSAQFGGLKWIGFLYLRTQVGMFLQPLMRKSIVFSKYCQALLDNIRQGCSGITPTSLTHNTYIPIYLRVK